MKASLFVTIGLFSVFFLPTESIRISSREIDHQWTVFKAKYNRQFRTVYDELLRKLIFHRNYVYIRKHNEKYEAGLSTYELGVNQFADLTNKEYNDQMNRLKVKHDVQSEHVFDNEDVSDLPDEVDWTLLKNVVAPIKDQKQCGSCWAFSAVASMESQNALKTGQLVELSEQELVDCSDGEGNEGCDGGWMDSAFEFVIKADGIDTEKSYPYHGVNQVCRSYQKNKTIGATIETYVDVKAKSEKALQRATAKVGPISVAIDASSQDFQLYKSGIYNEPDCSPIDLDHGVAVVGYGVLNGVPYWKVRNSWGVSWGMDGYILMSRNRHNQCGIASKLAIHLFEVFFLFFTSNSD
ncbi:Digestive cysteine proteinase 3 [Sarcoptes scabiei]|uniref:Digestive cysteine proteinase 3 n=1 Tax=Sarcoptes scabiei TaxID=52283 RepID=A0A834REW1_SARSC|nr:Digestive cysteine proteinase 3 [Sarcoptes scabiei]